MANRQYHGFEDRRTRDYRDMQRDPERLEGREHYRLDRDLDRNYMRPDPRTRDPPARPVYPYDQNGRDDSPFKHMDELRDRHRSPIELHPERRPEPHIRLRDYFLPGEDISRYVIQSDICKYLGNDATVRPFVHPDGRRGFIIKAYEPLTSAMIAKLKQDSRYDNERQQSSFAGVSSAPSPTFDDRERISRLDMAQPRFPGYPQDTSMMDYDDDPRPNPGYREEPRAYEQDPRISPRQELRPDPRQPLYQPQEPSSYQLQTSSAALDQASQQPRTLGPSNNPPLPAGRGGPVFYSGAIPVVPVSGYSIPTSVPLPTSRYVEPATTRTVGDYSSGMPYLQERHPSTRR